MTSSVPIIKLDIKSSHLAVRVLLNGVPRALSNGEPIEQNGIENEWIRPGTNTLQCMLVWPTGIPFAPGVARFSATLRVWNIQDDPEQLILERVMQWPQERVPEVYPKRLEDAFELPDFPGTTLWSDCDILQAITPRDRSSVRELLSGLHAAYTRQDVPSLMTLVRTKGRDLARAFGDKPEERLQAMQEFAHALFNTPGWGMQDLDLHALEMDLVAGQRLLEVTAPGRQFPIKSVRTREFEWAMPVYAGRTGDTWRIIR
ncbi:MAG: hypothetical protein KF866_11590 [Phycisphaeraceae bacterium]|nr:hypothetical protein [Phycisphaeraceae bacterium]MCW5754185.1 hypothetical protein [Phycisphaeraceae bacterium]